jgi:hypothetical protein
VLFEEESCSTVTMSDMAGTFSRAAARGKIALHNDECAPTTCVKPDSGMSFSRRGEMSSGNGWVY